MSMRRSRIQVKPNLGARGPKTTGNRPGKAEEKTNQSAASSDKPLSSPRKLITAPETAESSSAVNRVGNTPLNSAGKDSQSSFAGSKTKGQSRGGNQGENTPSRELNTDPVDSPAQVKTDNTVDQSDGVQPAEPHQAVSENEIELTKIKGRPPPTDDNVTKHDDFPEVDTDTCKLPAASPEKLETSTVKPAPRLRSRFLNRAKPNLTDAGRSRTRRQVKTVESSESPKGINSPVKTPVKTKDQSAHITCTDGEIRDSPTEDSGTGPEQTTVSTESNGKSLESKTPTPSDSSETCEDRLGAEVVIAEEGEGKVSQNDEAEVFTPPMPVTQPNRAVSPMSVADSDVSKDTEEMVEEPTPPSTRKQKRKVPKVTAPVDKPPDKFKMLMKDLIYWNPVTNPMKECEKKAAVNSDQVSTEKNDNTPAEDTEEAEELPVPQVKIGPDGSIVLNEESLVIEKPTDQSEMEGGVVEESESLITYSSFRTRHLSKNWTEKETGRFYYALSVVGTDFSMMSSLFKRRNRYDLKKKFKREEKYNRAQVDKALTNRKKIDMSMFENVSDEDEDSITKKAKAAKGGKAKGQKRGRRKSKENGKDKPGNKDKTDRKTAKKTKGGKKRRTVYYEEDSEESAEEGKKEAQDKTRDPAIHQSPRVPLELEDDEDENEEFRTVARKDPEGSSDEEEARVLKNMCQTTRSGRVPKRTSFYKEQERPIAPKRPRKETSVGVQADVPSEVAEPGEGQSSEAIQINTVERFPSLGGNQLVLVTQKGQGQDGTVIHVYLLSPNSYRSPEWSASPLTSPRTNPHVYSLSPRGPSAEGAASPQVTPSDNSAPVASTSYNLPVVCAEETVSTSEIQPTLQQAVLEAIRE